jgi:hypothetical protein
VVEGERERTSPSRGSDGGGICFALVADVDV